MSTCSSLNLPVSFESVERTRREDNDVVNVSLSKAGFSRQEVKCSSDSSRQKHVMFAYLSGDSLRYDACLASGAANNNGRVRCRQFSAHIGVAIIFGKYQVKIEFGLEFSKFGRSCTLRP
jgi:hypothetical protein